MLEPEKVEDRETDREKEREWRMPHDD